MTDQQPEPGAAHRDPRWTGVTGGIVLDPWGDTPHLKYIRVELPADPTIDRPSLGWSVPVDFAHPTQLMRDALDDLIRIVDDTLDGYDADHADHLQETLP